MVRVHKVQNGPKQLTSQNLHVFPPQVSFHNTGRGILTIFQEFMMHGSVLISESEPTRLLPKARYFGLITKSGKLAYEKGLLI